MSPNPERASTSPLGPLQRNISTAVGSVVKRGWSMKRSLMRWLARPRFVVSIGAACLRLTAQDVTVRPWSTSSKSNSPPKGRLLEFDLDRMFTDGLFADFAVFYRLLHASRLPQTVDTASACWLERYHQDSLDSGARIRHGLSRAVEQAIRDFANGFLAHSANDALRQAVSIGELQPDAYYQYLLRLIYRILFLMVIEERGLIFPPETDATKREMYDRYYSLQRLRRLAEKRYLADRRQHDIWLSILATFRLFEAGGPGHKLGIAPLAGDLFSPDAIGLLGRYTLGNDVLLGCVRSLGLYQHPDTGQIIRVNYAALNVEEVRVV